MKTISTLALAALAASSFAFDLTYSVTQIGVLPGMQDSIVRGLNDHGDVVGYSYSAFGQTKQAFRYTASGGMQGLGTLGGPNGYALAINNAGNIAGYSDTTTPDRRVATLWTADNSVHSLGVPTGGYRSLVSGINNRDEAVGAFEDISGTTPTACLLSLYGRESLGSLEAGYFSAAHSINDHGMVAGWGGTSAGISSFLWTRENGMQILPSVAGNKVSYAVDVNNSGEAVGYYAGNWDEPGYAYFYGPSVGQINFGAFASNAAAINDSGVVVGTRATQDGDRAFSWTQSGAFVDLTSLLDANGQGWTVSEAIDINASGQILASGWFGTGQSGYYAPVLLTPNVAPVPEPASLAALGLGAAAMLRRRKRS